MNKIVVLTFLCCCVVSPQEINQQINNNNIQTNNLRGSTPDNQNNPHYARNTIGGNVVIKTRVAPHSIFPQFPYFNRHTYYCNFSFYSGDDKYQYEVIPNRSDRNTLIIGVAVNLNYDKLENMISSLRKTGYRGKIIIMKPMNNDESYHYTKNNVKIINLQELYPFYPSDEVEYPIPNDLLMSLIPNTLPNKSFFYWHTMRFLLINVFLKVHYNKFSFIHTLDLRDSIFQINPFHWNYPELCVFVFEESRRFTIQSNAFTNQWANGFGAPNEVYSNTNINVGNLFGSSKELSDFISGFCDIIIQQPDIILRTSEQMIVNMFYYLHELFPYPVYFSRNEMGMARNFCQDLETDLYNFYPDSQVHLVRNLDGTIPCILHQYPTAIKLRPIERGNEYLNVLKNCIRPHQPFDSLSQRVEYNQDM